MGEKKNDVEPPAEGSPTKEGEEGVRPDTSAIDQNTSATTPTPKGPANIVRALDMGVDDPRRDGNGTGKKTPTTTCTPTTKPSCSTGKRSTPSNNISGKQSKGTTPGRAQKRDAQCVPKQNEKMNVTVDNEDNYSQVLHDLAAAVKKSPPKRDKLEKWSDVLVEDMRELPDDTQYEARHTIDGYIMRLRRAAKSGPGSTQGNMSTRSEMPANPMAASNSIAAIIDQYSYAATQGNYNQAAAPSAQNVQNMDNNQAPQIPPIINPQAQTQQAQQQNYNTLSNYSPSRSQGLPGILNNSPAAADFLQKLLGQTNYYQPYHGQL